MSWTPTRRSLIAAAMLVVAAVQPMRAQPNGQVVVFTGARVIDGTGAAPLQPATIVIANGRIASVGAPDSVPIPTGATLVDMWGKTVLPGLINAHGHLNVDDNTTLPDYEVSRCVSVLTSSSIRG